MSFHWINAEDYSFNSILLMDRWILRYLVNHQDANYCKHMGIALLYNPVVKWYFKNKAPETAERVAELVKNAPLGLSVEEARKSEMFILAEIDSFIVYVYPEVMEQLDYIRLWDRERLLEMVDFTDKVVLDIGSGTGRLTFTAATKAKWVYASEPVDRLREFMREKQKRMQVNNVTVVDGTVEVIPYPDDTFDIVMSAHVLGDNYDREYAEMSRVVKSGCYIIDCIGEDDGKREKPKDDMLRLGFEYSHYVSKTGGDIYRYIKQVIK